MNELLERRDDLLLHVLELVQGLAELHATFDVIEALAEDVLHLPDERPRREDALANERELEELAAVLRPTEHAIGGELDVFEEDLAGRRAMTADEIERPTEANAAMGPLING